MFQSIGPFQLDCNKPQVQACRLCLDTESALFSISEYMGSIKLLTGIMVTTKDGLPQYICNCCKYLVKKFVTFRNRCHIAHNTLFNVCLMKIEVTTDFISTLDRAALNLTLPFHRVDDTIDCLNEYYTDDSIVPKQEDHNADFCDPLESYDEIPSADNQSELSQFDIKTPDDKLGSPQNDIHTLDDQSSSSEYESDILGNQSELLKKEIGILADRLQLAKDESNNTLKIVIDMTSNKTHTENINSLNIFDSGKAQNSTETSEICESVSEEEPEVLPTVKISKETKVNLNMKLSMTYKTLLERFFLEQIKYKKLLSVKKACQLERVQKVLQYNGSELIKQYEEEPEPEMDEVKTGIYICVRSDKKRAEFEEEFNTKVEVLTKEQQMEEFHARALSLKYKRKLFKCNVCYLGFMVEKVYIKHLNIHKPNRGKHECNICHYRFASHFKYREHILSHELKFICKDCGYTTNMLNVAKDHHGRHEGHTYKCKYCSENFSARSTYFQHMKLSHASDQVPCDICGETFLGEKGLKLHMSWTHEVVGPKSNASKCKTCNIRFNSIKAMNNHLSSWDDRLCQPGVISCVECGENFENDELLQAHSVVHIKTFVCKKCDMLFIDKASLNVHHERTHLNIKQRPKMKPIYRKNIVWKKLTEKKDLRVMCEYCGKSLACKFLLSEHINAHLGLKPYCCDLCSKSFTKKFYLQKHLKVHTGERPFKCDVCDFAFHSSGNLKRHKDIIHTGLKRFQCHICSKKFGCKSTQSLHIRTVHMKLPHPPRKKRNRARTGKQDKPET